MPLLIINRTSPESLWVRHDFGTQALSTSHCGCKHSDLWPNVCWHVYNAWGYGCLRRLPLSWGHLAARPRYSCSPYRRQVCTRAGACASACSCEGLTSLNLASCFLTQSATMPFVHGPVAAVTDGVTELGRGAAPAKLVASQLSLLLSYY